MSEQLRSCPFCGGDAFLRSPTLPMVADDVQVSCNNCDTNGPAILFDQDVHGETDLPELEAEAIAAWNTRAAPATDEALVEVVTKAILFEDCGNTEDWEENTHLGNAVIATMQAHITAKEQAIRNKALDEAAARCADRVARAEQAIRICPKKDAEFHREARDTAKFLGAAILALKEQHNG